jgi:hypothetical protein
MRINADKRPNNAAHRIGVRRLFVGLSDWLLCAVIEPAVDPRTCKGLEFAVCWESPLTTPDRSSTKDQEKGRITHK